MTSGEVTLFPDITTMLWTLINLILLLAIPTALGFGIYYLTRMNRTMQQISTRLEHLEQKQQK